jgi:MFS family permease
MSVLVVHGTGATTELCQKARLSPPSTATARLEAREEDFVLSSSFTAATVARESSVQQQDPPPDGGVKAWTQAAMGWLVIFTTWGYINSFGAFQTYYNEVMSESHATISWIGSIQAFLTFFVGSFSGQLMDSGYFLSTMTVGAILQLLGIFLMGASTRYGALMATQGVLTGVGNGLLFTPTLSLLATYFERRRGLALGIVTTGNSIGGMVYPVVVRQLLPSVGFAWTSRVLGFINLACLASVLVFMRPRLAPRKTGPMLDFTAYKEPVYLACVAGLFFSQWAVFYTFYSVSSCGKASDKLWLTWPTRLPHTALRYWASRTLTPPCSSPLSTAPAFQHARCCLSSWTA